MKTIAIIPARGGSKRLPGKNILHLGGIPLLAHSILYAKANSAIIDEIFVTTDDPAIKEIALQFGANVIDRPTELSGDYEPTVSALKHAINVMGNNVEHVILLQPTNPLRPKQLLSEAWELFHSGAHNSLMTVTRNHQKLGKIVGRQFVPFNYEIGQRSQDLDPLYFENGLLYITKTDLILNDIIVDAQGFPMEVHHPFASVDVDTKEDFEYAEYLFKRLKD